MPLIPVPPSFRRYQLLRISCRGASFLLLCCSAGALLAQTGNNATIQGQGAPAPAAQPKMGLQVTSASAYGTYYSSGLPNTGGGFQTNVGNLPYDVGLGGSITIGWTKSTERSTFLLNYTASYTADLRYSSLNALNHAFSLNFTRKLAPRWNLTFSVGGNYSNLEETAFSPSTLSNVASVPSSASDLSAGVLASKFTNNPQLGAVLTSSPLASSPVANLFYGERMFTTSVQGSLAYSFSPRLTITFNGGASHSQNASGSQTSSSSVSALIQDTTSETAGATFLYSLSPFSQLGGMVTSSRISSSLELDYTTTSQATYGRTLGRQWFTQLHGGLGFTNLVRSGFPTGTPQLASKPGPVAGGSVGFKTSSNTLLASFDRTVNDSYGSGATSNYNASGTWRWHRLGSTWMVQSSFEWQRLTGSVLANTSGWRVTAGLNRAFGPHFRVLWEYAYLNYSGGLLVSASSLSQSAVRVSMIWTPPSNMLR